MISPISSRVSGSVGGGWGMVRTTVTTIAARTATVMTSAIHTRRRVGLRRMRTGSYILDTPWRQVDTTPAQRGHGTAVFVGYRPTIMSIPQGRPLARATRPGEPTGSRWTGID